MDYLWSNDNEVTAYSPEGVEVCTLGVYPGFDLVELSMPNGDYVFGADDVLPVFNDLVKPDLSIMDAAGWI